MPTTNIFDLADTWNSGGTTFTSIKMNVTDTASAADSLLLDLLVGNTSRFKVDKRGTIFSKPVAISNERFPARYKWDNPASGNSIWPIYIEPLSSSDLGVSSPGHGAFGIQVELTDFGGYYDCIYNIGMHGDGITTVRNLQVWETGYDITSGLGLLSNERYDVVHHPNATHWPIRRRMGWGYSTYDTNQGTISLGVSSGFADMDQIEFRSTYVNPNNPSVGEFGTYLSLSPNYQTGGMQVDIFSKLRGACQIALQGAGLFISSTRRIAINVPSNDPSGSVPYSITIDNNLVHLLYTTAAYYNFLSAADTPKEIVCNNLNNDSSVSQFRAINPSGRSGSFGCNTAANGSSTYVSASHGFLCYTGDTQKYWVGGEEIMNIAISNVKLLKPLIIPTATPASSSATGVTGTLTWDSSYLYMCTATDTWKRAALSSW